MPGASSVAVHEVRLEDGRALVVRRYVWSRYLDSEPDAPDRELAALTYAAAHRIAAPVVIAADLQGADVGDGVPVILMTRLAGRAHAAPDPGALAMVAANLHRSGGSDFGHAYSPWCRDTSTVPPKGCRDTQQWSLALDIWRTAEPAYERRFIHRDFHPGNLLWHRNRFSGIVDWSNACVGPTGVDIATCRWNLCNWADSAVADAFVAAYEQLVGQPHDAYWDVARIVEDDWDLTDDPVQVAEAEVLLSAAVERWREQGSDRPTSPRAGAGESVSKTVGNRSPGGST
jgi:aminoglycoside phosphotransferase (APT) family kinase protein